MNSDGTLDGNFGDGMGINGQDHPNVGSLIVQSDGKVLLAGHFTTVNGTARTNIARLNPDGSRDGSFNAQIGGLADPLVQASPFWRFKVMESC